MKNSRLLIVFFALLGALLIGCGALHPTLTSITVAPANATAQERSYYVSGNGLTGAVIPTSNFEPLPWVLQLESLGLALTHVSATSVQRILRLGTPEFTHLRRFLSPDALSIAYAAIQKIPADLDAENRDLSNPVSTAAIPVAGDIEDTATNAAAAAAHARSSSRQSCPNEDA